MTDDEKLPVCTLSITDPHGDAPVIEPWRHFAVEGKIRASEPLPCDAVLTVTVIDGDGNTVRRVRQAKKDSRALYLSHPDLTLYPPETDPDLHGLERFGFPPLMVRDAEEPLRSLRDATVKCYYDDEKFKAIIVGATDVAHGLLLPDGMDLTDENGRPYSSLPMGKFTVRVTLQTRDGTELACAEKDVTAGTKKDQVICRFNPASHREKMTRWADENGFSIMNDLIPGYLDAYAGKWLYHMGLLKMYRACDAAMYAEPNIRLFIYDITADSTSYSTELAFLAKLGRLGDSSRFFAYCYDIGEPEINGRKGKITRFGDDEFIKICRVDSVRDTATEGAYFTDGRDVMRSMAAGDAVTVYPGERFSVVGAIRPWQTDPDGFLLCDDNTYFRKSPVSKLEYTFDDGEKKIVAVREPGLTRVSDGNEKSTSVLEFSNVFAFDGDFAGRTVTLTVRGFTPEGEAPSAARIKIHFMAASAAENG